MLYLNRKYIYIGFNNPRINFGDVFLVLQLNDISSKIIIKDSNQTFYFPTSELECILYVEDKLKQQLDYLSQSKLQPLYKLKTLLNVNKDIGLIKDSYIVVKAYNLTSDILVDLGDIITDVKFKDNCIESLLLNNQLISDISFSSLYNCTIKSDTITINKNIITLESSIKKLLQKYLILNNLLEQFKE